MGLKIQNDSKCLVELIKNVFKEFLLSLSNELNLIPAIIDVHYTSRISKLSLYRTKLIKWKNISNFQQIMKLTRVIDMNMIPHLLFCNNIQSEAEIWMNRKKSNTKTECTLGVYISLIKLIT